MLGEAGPGPGHQGAGEHPVPGLPGGAVRHRGQPQSFPDGALPEQGHRHPHGGPGHQDHDGRYPEGAGLSLRPVEDPPLLRREGPRVLLREDHRRQRHPGPGDEVHRRGAGPGPHLPRGPVQGLRRRRLPPLHGQGGPPQRGEPRAARGGGPGQEDRRSEDAHVRHGGHCPGHPLPGHPGPRDPPHRPRVGGLPAHGGGEDRPDRLHRRPLRRHHPGVHRAPPGGRAPLHRLHHRPGHRQCHGQHDRQPVPPVQHRACGPEPHAKGAAAPPLRQDAGLRQRLHLLRQPGRKGGQPWLPVRQPVRLALRHRRLRHRPHGALGRGRRQDAHLQPGRHRGRHGRQRHPLHGQVPLRQGHRQEGLHDH